MDVEFCGSPRNTLGVEVELAVVDDETGALLCVASDVIAGLASGRTDGAHPFAKNELYESVIEVITGINDTVAEAKADLSGTVAEVQAALAPRGASLICPGVHPFAEWAGLRQTRTERYDQLVDSIQWPARRLMTSGVHFHVGVRSGEHAVAVTTGLIATLPHFLALSASSPFWHGHDTGLASVRTKIMESLPTNGLPPRLHTWTEFERFMGTMINAGSISSVREVWWDVRPHPDFGTVELRMCDGLPTLHEVASLAALAQCLVADLEQRADAGETLFVPSEWVARENKWRAARFGADAHLVVDDSGRTEPLADGVHRLVEHLAPQADRLGCADELKSVLGILDTGPSYRRQRQVVADGGTTRDVVAALRRELVTDRPGA